MINEWLKSISEIILKSTWLAPVFSLLAGILTSFLPCSLSTIPLVIGYVGGVSNSGAKKAFRLSAAFALGMAATFTALGVIASLAGKLLGAASSWWYIVLGILMTLMALQTWGIYSFIPSSYLTGKSGKRGFLGALLAGILGGIFASPCSTPVLITLLALVSAGGSLLWGALLLLLYSAGHSALILITGTSLGFVRKLTSNERYGKVSKAINIVLGCLILFLALYMFYLGF